MVIVAADETSFLGQFTRHSKVSSQTGFTVPNCVLLLQLLTCPGCAQTCTMQYGSLARRSLFRSPTQREYSMARVPQIVRWNSG